MPEINSKLIMLNGKLPVRELATCTPLPGLTKLQTPNIHQLALKVQPLSSSRNLNKFPTTTELLLKLTRISVIKFKEISRTTPKILNHKRKFSRRKFRPNGSHRPKRSTNLTFKSLTKLPDSGPTKCKNIGTKCTPIPDHTKTSCPLNPQAL